MASSIIKAHHDWLHFVINERLKNTEPAKVVAVTAGTTLALAYIYSQLTNKVVYGFHHLGLLRLKYFTICDVIF